jgi:hypothetical protein
MKKNLRSVPLVCESCRQIFQDHSCFKRENREALDYLSSFSFCMGCGWELAPEASFKDEGNGVFGVELRNDIPTREPVGHASHLARALRDFRNFDAIEIFAYGKNSIPLTKALTQSFSANTTTNLSPTVTRFSSNPYGAHELTLHCFIRIFEHLADPLSYFIGASVSKGDLIYIESVDFQRCAEEGDFSYLWRKRLRYIQPIDYEGCLPGLKVLKHKELRISRTTTNEPIQGQLFEFLGYPELAKQRQRTYSSPRFHSLPGVVKKFQDLIRATEKKIGIVGLGHKGLTLAHAVQDLGKHELSLFDDTCSNVRIGNIDYVVSPIREAKGVLLLSTLNPILTSRLLPSFNASDVLDYPIVLSEIEQ